MKLLTCHQAYIKMFYFLDYCYDNIEVDDLGGLLGSMNPFLFAGEIPIDDKIMLDWLAITKCLEAEKKLNVDEAFEALIIFLMKQKQNFKLEKIDFLCERIKNSNTYKSKWHLIWEET
jgi:hypothetical protein